MQFLASINQTAGFYKTSTFPAPRPEVITMVESQEPAVLLTCAIEGDITIRSCKFMDPVGRVLMAPRGVGEDRYSFHGGNVR